MKKVNFILFLFFSFQSFGQDEIFLDFQYLPNHEYLNTQVMVTKNKIKYSGSDEILEQLKAGGIEQETSQKDSIFTKTLTRTFQLKDNSMHFELDVLSSNDDALKNGVKVFGNAVNKNFSVDSVHAEMMSVEAKEMLKTSMAVILNDVVYPEEKIKVGESIEHTDPISMPIGAMILEIEMNSIYTLNKIENGIGYFDLKQIYNVESEIEGVELTFSGSGKGKLEYDNALKHFTKTELAIRMDFDTPVEGVGIQVQVENYIHQNIEIKPADH